MAEAKGTKEQPWVLKTPPGTSEYTMYKDETHNPPILVCTVGKTVLQYDLRSINDLHEMLKKYGDWMELGSADEQKPAKDWTYEESACISNNDFGNSILMSIQAFRGRPFSSFSFQSSPTNPYLALESIEAIFGLLIEALIVAIFTQRILGKWVGLVRERY